MSEMCGLVLLAQERVERKRELPGCCKPELQNATDLMDIRMGVKFGFQDLLSVIFFLEF